MFELTNPAGKVYVFRGIAEQETCEHCGRTNLKSTIALEDQQSGQVVHFGSTCAARALRWKDGDRKVTPSTLDTAERARLSEIRKAAGRAGMQAALPILRAMLAAGSFPTFPADRFDDDSRGFPFVPPETLKGWTPDQAAQFDQAGSLFRDTLRATEAAAGL